MVVNSVKAPAYVDHHTAHFKHDRLGLTFKVVSDWEAVEDSMLKVDRTLTMYFPRTIDLTYDDRLEKRLADDIQTWTFFASLPPKLAQLSINLSHLCSFRSELLSYERRVLLHHHVAWIFLMDHVTEELPMYGLHDTAGRAYLDSLKSITLGKSTPVALDLPDCCPKDIQEAALMAQRILAEDLMPLKRTLLAPQHMQACIDTLLQFFGSEYQEGHKFCQENPSKEILTTRVITVGGMLPMLLTMSPAQAEFYMVNDPGLINQCQLMALINDIFGLYKDLESIENENDGSAYLNLVRVGMREHGVNDKDAVRLYVKRLNSLTRSTENFLTAFPSSKRAYYLEALRLVFNYFDYHLVGIMNNPNNRYGWRPEE